MTDASRIVPGSETDDMWPFPFPGSESEDRVALLDTRGTPPMRYGALRETVGAIAHALGERGVRRGDAVALVTPNGPIAATAFLGVAAHTVCAPLNPHLRPAELAFELDDLSIRAVVVAGDHPVVAVAEERGVTVLRAVDVAERGAGACRIEGGDVTTPDAPPRFTDDVALALHTSGTTARPKIVPLTRANLAASARNVARVLTLSSDDRALNVMPLFHIHGLVAALLASLRVGASVVCTDGFYAPDVAGWISSCEPTWTTAVPTIHLALLARPDAATAGRGRLRFLRSSSAPLAPALLGDLERAFGVPVVEAYGMTEAAHQIACNPLPPGERRPGTVGRAAGPELAVMGPEGELLPAGATGEIVLRGQNVTSAYVTDDPGVNARAFAHGWFHTGDQGHVDDDGYVTITGRLKELINRGGEKIAPREVDDVLVAHPAVATALTFAVPDARLGEQVAAAVVLAEGADARERELREFVALRLAAHKVPRRVVFVHDLPKGPTGKPARIGLAERLGLADLDRDERGPMPHTAPRDDVERWLAREWSTVLGVHDPSVHDRFLDLGGDSMLATRLLARVRAALAVELSMLDFYDAPTIAAQAALVARHLAGER